MLRRPSERELEPVFEAVFLPAAVGSVACVIALLYAGFWVQSHPQFMIEDLLFVTVLALLVSLAAAPVVIVVAGGAVLLLGGGLLLLCACLFVPLASVWLVVRRSPRVFYESIRAVCVTAVNVLLYPRCKFCGHHHLHAITRRPTLVAGGCGRCPATR